MKENIEVQIKDIIKKSINHNIPNDELNGNDDLALFGVTSKNFLKVIVAIETEFGLEFEDEYLDFAKLRNIKNLTDYVQSRMSEMKL